MSDNDPGHRIRADCTVCGTSHLAGVPKNRVDPDPAIRAEAVGDSPEDWRNAPPRRQFEASCPQCDSVTGHEIPSGRYAFPGGFSVPTTHERADAMNDSDTENN